MSHADCRCRRRTGRCGCAGAVKFIDDNGPPAWQRVAAVERGYREAQRAQQLQKFKRGRWMRIGGSDESPTLIRVAGGSFPPASQCPSWARGLRSVVLDSRGEPQGWFWLAQQISFFTKPLLSIVYGGAVVLEPYSLLIDVLHDCDFGSTVKKKLAEASGFYAVQSLILSALTPLMAFNPVVAAGVGAAAAISLVLSNVTNDLSKGRAPSVGNLLNLAAPLTALGTATGKLSPSAAATINAAASSETAKTAAKQIDKQTGAEPVATTTNLQEEAATSAMKAALVQAGVDALNRKRDPWPAFEQKAKDLAGLKRTIADGTKAVGGFLDLLKKAGGPMIRKGGGKSALFLAALSRTFARARSGSYLLLPVETQADVVRWVDSKGSAFLVDKQTGEAPTAGTAGAKKDNTVLFILGGLGLALAAGGGAAAARRKKKKETA